MIARSALMVTPPISNQPSQFCTAMLWVTALPRKPIRSRLIPTMNRIKAFDILAQNVIKAADIAVLSCPVRFFSSSTQSANMDIGKLYKHPVPMPQKNIVIATSGKIAWS